MDIKKVLAYTNPIAWVVGIPLALGVWLSVCTYGSVRKTKKIVENLVENE
jgi:hypothetical protein